MLTEKLLKRFQRNMALPEIGISGQEKLMSSSALVIGCGGLGSPVMIYLSAMGTGRLGIADADRVDISNLQRQIIHYDENIGELKTDSACEKLKKFFPEIIIELYSFRLDKNSLGRIAGSYDVIIDCTDNFESRYTINQVAVELGKPVVFGAVLGFFGQVTTVIPVKSGCYRCLFPEPPPDSLFPGSDRLGVLGSIPGITGAIQATEAVKMLTGVGKTLTNRLLLIDGFSMLFDSMPFEKNPDCPVCGKGIIRPV